MARIKILPASKAEDVGHDVARLRALDLEGLRANWQTAFRGKPPRHLPRHLLFRILAYRYQAERSGDLDIESKRLLDRPVTADDTSKARAAPLTTTLRPGTILGREWNGKIYRVTVMESGFAWEGRIYQSLSTVAAAMTGTRWNGPRFFGLRDAVTKRTAKP